MGGGRTGRRRCGTGGSAGPAGRRSAAAGGTRGSWSFPEGERSLGNKLRRRWGRGESRADLRQLEAQLARHLGMVNRVQLGYSELPGRGWLDSELRGEGDRPVVRDDEAGGRRVSVGDPAVDVGPVDQH